MRKYKIAKISIVILVFALIVSSCGDNEYEENGFSSRNPYKGNYIGNLMSASSGITYNGNYIFFSAFRPGNYTRLYKSNINGRNIALLAEYQTANLFDSGTAGIHFPADSITGVNVINDWVYFIGAERMIYKVEILGGNNQRISDRSASKLFVYGENFYFIGRNEEQRNNNLYVMDLYGNNLELLHDGFISRFYFYDEHIYFSRYGSIYKMDFDGSNVLEIFNTLVPIHGLHINDGKIYFVMNFGLYKTDIDGSNKMRIGEVGRILGNAMNFYENYFFYVSLESGFLGSERTIFHQINLETGSVRRRRINHRPLFIYVINDRIFFHGIRGLYSMNFNGSNLRRFN